MNDRKIKKVFFISEKRKAICTDEKIYICDEKDNIEKIFESKNSDLFQVKNSDLLAYVKYEPIKPQDPMARRNAITAYDLTRRGKTTLIDSEKLTVVAEIPHPLAHPVALLQNQVIAGMSGQCVSCYFRDHNVFAVAASHNPRMSRGEFNVVVLTDTHFGVLNESSLYTFRVLPESFDFANQFNHVSGVCPLMNGQFFMQRNDRIGIYQTNETYGFTVHSNAINSNTIDFAELLLLSDNVTLMGRSKDNNFYLIDTNTFSIEELPLKLEPIVQMALAKNGNLMGITPDGRYLDLDSYILQHSKIGKILYRDTEYPTDLIDMIVGYERSYRRFFEIISPVREVLNHDTAYPNDCSGIISDYDGRYLKFSGNTSEIVEKEIKLNTLKKGI